MIWGKGWTTPTKHKFSYLPLTPIFRSSLYIIAPQEYSALQLPMIYTQLHALHLPVTVTQLGNLPVLCWAAVFSSPDEELAETYWSSTALVSTGHSCCCFPPHPGSAFQSPNLSRRHLLHVPYKCLLLLSSVLGRGFSVRWIINCQVIKTVLIMPAPEEK